MSFIARRSRRNNLLLGLVLLTVILFFTHSSREIDTQQQQQEQPESLSTWQKVKKVFQDDKYNEYKQINNGEDGDSGLAGAFAKNFKNIDLSNMFVPSPVESSVVPPEADDSKENNVENNGIRFTPDYQKARAAFYTIFKSSDMTALLNTVHSIEERFNNKFHYDWIFVTHKNLNTSSKKMLANSVSGNTIFYVVPGSEWGMPAGVDRKKANAARRKSRLHGITSGVADLLRYRARYQAGFFPFSEPVQNYQYYMRVEAGVEFKCDVPEDFFQTMASKELKYGIVSARKDAPKATETLWESVTEWALARKGFVIPELARTFFLDEESNTFDQCYIPNSLEIFDIEFLRTKEYQELFEHLDSKKGWFYERWTDSHIHSIAAFLFLKPQEIKFFSIAHKTPEYDHCFELQANYFENNCYCDPTKDRFFDKEKSCILKLVSSLGKTDLSLARLAKEKKLYENGLTSQDIIANMEFPDDETGSLYVKEKNESNDQQDQDDNENENENESENENEHENETA